MHVPGDQHLLSDAARFLFTASDRIRREAETLSACRVERSGGILNGIDYDIWSLLNDKLLSAAYTADDLAGKAICRKRLVEMTGWNDDGKPIMTFIGRLFQQKGVDILTTCLERTMAGRYRVALIGSGLPQYESWIHEFQQRHPDCF